MRLGMITKKRPSESTGEVNVQAGEDSVQAGLSFVTSSDRRAVMMAATSVVAGRTRLL